MQAPLSRADRVRMVGNAVNGAHMHHILKHLRDPHTTRLIACPATIHEKTSEQVELYLSAMCDTQLDAWFANAFKGKELLKLSMRLKASHLPPAKPKGPYEGTAMKSGLSTSLKSFFIISPCYQVQHGGYN